jgi:hypothetical protein
MMSNTSIYPTTQCHLKPPAREKGDGECVPYSRTADAESVVLNFAKVLTYSRVLLYTLRERQRDRETEERRKRRTGWERVMISCQYEKMDGESTTRGGSW